MRQEQEFLEVLVPAPQGSRNAARFDVQTLTEGGKGRFDLIQTGVVPKRKQRFDVGLRYPDPTGKFRLLQTWVQKRTVQIEFRSLQGWQRRGTELRTAVAPGRRLWSGFPNV